MLWRNCQGNVNGVPPWTNASTRREARRAHGRTKRRPMPNQPIIVFDVNETLLDIETIRAGVRPALRRRPADRPLPGGCCDRVRGRVMPVTRTAIRDGKPPEYKQALMDEIYETMRETVAIKEGDRFMAISEHRSHEFAYGAFLDVDRSDDLVQIQVFWAPGKTVAAKRAMYRRMVERLGSNPGVRAEDVPISVVESPAENWSFGNGETQFYEPDDRDGRRVSRIRDNRSACLAAGRGDSAGCRIGHSPLRRGRRDVPARGATTPDVCRSGSGTARHVVRALLRPRLHRGTHPAQRRACTRSHRSHVRALCGPVRRDRLGLDPLHALREPIRHRRPGGRLTMRTEPPRRAGRRAGASSVAPIARLSGLPASFHRTRPSRQDRRVSF